MASRSGRWARDRWRPEEEARRDSRPHSNAPRDNNHRPESDTASPSLRSPANETIGFGNPNNQSQHQPQQHHQSHYDDFQPPVHNSRHQDRHQDRPQDRHQDRPHDRHQPSHSAIPSNMGSRVTSGSAPHTPLPAPVVAPTMQAMLPPPPPPCFPTPQSSPEELEGYRLWYDKYATLYQQYIQYQAQMEQQQHHQPTPPRSMDRQFSSTSAPSGELRQHHRDYDPRDAPRAQYEDPRDNISSRAVDPRDPRDMREGQTQDQRRDLEIERRARQDAGRITKTHEQYTGEVKLAESKTLRLYCPVTPLDNTEQYDRFDPEALNPARHQRDAMDALEGRVPAQQSAHRSKAQQAEERYREYANTFTSGFVHNALYRCHPLEYQDGDHIARKQRLEEEGANNRQRKHKKNADPDIEIAEVMDPSARRELVDDEGHDAVDQYHGRFRSGPSLAESHEAEQVLNRRRGLPFTTIAAAQEA